MPDDPDNTPDLDADKPIRPYDGEFDPSLLTEEERKALEDDMSEPDLYDPDAEPEPEPAPAQAQTPATEAKAPDQTPATPPVVPDFDAEANQKALDAAIAKEKTLREQFDDGQISDSEYTEQLKAITKEVTRLEDAAAAHNQAVAAARQATEAAWQSAISAHKAANPALYTPEMLQAWDQTVQFVTGNPANAKLGFAEVLAKAQKVFAAENDRPDLAPAAPKAQPKAAAPTAQPAPKAEPVRVQPVPTLTRLPAADQDATGQNAFAHIDALMAAGQVEKAEAAYRRLTPEQRDAYERMTA